MRSMTFEEYTEIAAVNFSTLKEIAKSAAHYRHRLTTPREDTPAMRFGRAVHTAVLDPDRFPLDYVVFENGARRGKVWDEFAAVNASKTILKPDEYATCLAVRDAVRAHPAASELLGGAMCEATVEWHDDATSIPCKGRLDAVGECIVDLKTTGSVDPFMFEGLSARMFYHAQLAFYSRGVERLDNPCIIAVETDAPYDVAVFRFTDDAMLAGNQAIDDWLAHLAVCLDRDEWPGRCGGVQDMGVPPWCAVDEHDLGVTIGGEKV